MNKFWEFVGDFIIAIIVAIMLAWISKLVLYVLGWIFLIPLRIIFGSVTITSTVVPWYSTYGFRVLFTIFFLSLLYESIMRIWVRPIRPPASNEV